MVNSVQIMETTCMFIGTCMLVVNEIKNGKIRSHYLYTAENVVKNENYLLYNKCIYKAWLVTI